MAQNLFGTLTAPSLPLLDANFTELYSLYNSLSPSGGVLVGTVSCRFTGTTAPSTAAQAVSVSGSSVTWTDPTRAANNKLVEWTWGVGSFRGRFLNDAYSSAADFMSVTGGQASGVTGVILSTAGGSVQLDGSGHLSSQTDNSKTCGTAALRWSVVYAATGSINTSDAREKEQFAALTSAELAAAQDLARAIGTFKWRAAVAAKGAAATKHVGLTVQGAIAILQAHALDPAEYGFICHDTWAEDGEPGQPGYVAAGDRYGFITDELLALVSAGLEARLTALEAAAA